MKKKEAIKLLGFVDIKTLAAALKISKQAVYLWPDELPQRLLDEMVGLAVRLGRDIPPEVLAESTENSAETVQSV